MLATQAGRFTAARVVGAGALLAGAGVHVAQLMSIFHAVPWIGPLFALDALASTALALVLLVTRSRLAAAAGAAVSAGALAGLALSSTVGLFGWEETLLRPAVVLAIGAELVALAALVPLAVPAAPGASGPSRPRAAAAAGLVLVGVLHLAAAEPEWEDARGLFWLFVALAAACLALAVRLLVADDPWRWAAVLVLAVTPAVGFALSRSVGLPGAADDIGDWADPLGVASLAVEAALATLALGFARAPTPLRWARHGFAR